MKKLFLGSSQTQECSDAIVKAEQVHSMGGVPDFKWFL